MELIPRKFNIDLDEWTNLLVSILAISISITLASYGLNVSSEDFIFLMGIVTVIVGTAFFFHEMAHKYAAVHYGAKARFEAWFVGIMLMMGMAILPQFLGFRIPLFLAPGAVMVYSMNLTNKKNGIISAAGPMTNLVLSVLFIIVSSIHLTVSGGAPYSELDYLLANIFTWGAKINFFLAFFNLIPIFPLDGVKVLVWDWRVWLCMFAIAFLGTNLYGGVL